MCEPGCVDERQRIWELLWRGHAHEQAHDLGPARQLLTEALDAASAADMPEVVRTSRSLLGIVAHKADRLDEARAHLDAALPLALDAGDREDEAYCRQELGFLLLDTGDPELALGEFHAVLALAPGVGIVNLAGNGLNGMGVALLQLGRASQAVPFLLAALAIRAESRTSSNNTSTSCTSRPRRWRSTTQASPRGSPGSSTATPTPQPGCTGTTDARCGPCSTRPSASTPTPWRASTRPGS